MNQTHLAFYFAEALSERTSEWHNRSQIAVMMLVSYNQ